MKNLIIVAAGLSAGFTVYFFTCWFREIQLRSRVERVLLDFSMKKKEGGLKRKPLRIGIFLLAGSFAILMGGLYLVLAVSGLFLVFWIMKSERKSARVAKLEHSLPPFLDFLSLALSSGLNLESAFEGAIQNISEGPLKEDLGRMKHALDLGHGWRGGYETQKDYFSGSSLGGIFRLITEAMENGIPLYSMLRHQADSLRVARMAALEKRAQSAGLRLLLPIMIFIFPALFIVLFGALFLKVSQQGFFF